MAMTNRDPISTRRLRNQRITRTGFAAPEQVVDWMGAVQAQEYEPATWALALRMKGNPVRTDIETAFEEGRILRTHVMRPTWHFVTPEAIRWLLDLTGPCVQRRMAVYNRRLELDPPTMTRAAKIFERALRDRQFLTRTELGERLRRAGLEATTMRLAHLAMHAELEGVICSGPRRGRQFTYGLIAERAPDARRLERDEALAELARRFLRSHGPATVRDFVWWSGLATADAKRGFEACRAASEAVDGLTYWSVESSRAGALRDAAAHLLPIYDEYRRRLSRPCRRAARALRHHDRVWTAGDFPARGDHRRSHRRHVADVSRLARCHRDGDTAAPLEARRAPRARGRQRALSALSRVAGRSGD